LPTGTSCGDTLLLTLAKNQDEKRALGETFDCLFSQPEVKTRPRREDATRGYRQTARAGCDGPAKPVHHRRNGRAGAGCLMSQDRKRDRRGNG